MTQTFTNLADYISCDVKSHDEVYLSTVLSDSHSCMICRSDYKPNEPVLLLPCNHMFHFECLLPLKQKQMGLLSILRHSFKLGNKKT